MSRSQLDDLEIRLFFSLVVGVPTFVDSGAERYCPATSGDDANTLLSTIADLVFND